jgi:peptide/nickel transport system permease protein
MLKYLLKRLFYAIFVLFGVATIVFFLTRMTGDPVAIMLPPDAGQAQIDQLKNTLGLDKPLIVQYGIYLKNLLHFDFGQSLRYFEPASNLLLEKLPATLKLALTALLISLCIAIPAGIIAALKKGSVIDQGIMLIVMAGQSMPVFWVGILLVMLFSIQLHWLPTGGYGGLKNMILPSIALGFNLMTLTTRLLRSSLIEVMETDYIRTARAKGLRLKAVITKHALRNSLLPVVTVVGLQLGAMLGGSVVTETVFAWPGVGQMLVQAIQYRDFPLVQATIVTLAGAFVFINLVVDILYVFIDPRIQLK